MNVAKDGCGTTAMIMNIADGHQISPVEIIAVWFCTTMVGEIKRAGSKRNSSAKESVKDNSFIINLKQLLCY